MRDAELRVAARDGDLEGLALAGFAARAVARLAEEARGDTPGAGGRARRARAAGAARGCAGGRGVKILRLRLRNYRGIAEREIEFAPAGVTIVSGPNEVGKSSLAEAIELLFDERDDTAKQRVREIQPVDRDEGSEVEADVELGPFRFTYAKRFHRKSETRLSVRAPRVEQATGREAHERVRALLDAHLDVALWRALRIAQGAPLDAPALAGAASLAAALDRAAGVGAGGEREESLFERARAAYDLHFTPTGRARRGSSRRSRRSPRPAPKRRNSGRGSTRSSATSRRRRRCARGSPSSSSGSRRAAARSARSKQELARARGAARRGRPRRRAARGRARAGVGRGVARAPARSARLRTRGRAGRDGEPRGGARERGPRAPRGRGGAAPRRGAAARGARARARPPRSA